MREIDLSTLPPLMDARAAAVLQREHERAKGDDSLLAGVKPAIDAARAAGQPPAQWSTLYPEEMSLAVSARMGEFLHLAVLTHGSRFIVEFGTSFGVSTIYLASAARLIGGRVIGSEQAPGKAERAVANLEEAGLADVAEVRVGNARETLAVLDEPVDLLFLDGWKDLYLPILKLLEPKLRPGALVMADNIHTFPDELATYLAYVRDPDGPYRTTVIPFVSGLAFSLYQAA